MGNEKPETCTVFVKDTLTLLVCYVHPPLLIILYFGAELTNALVAIMLGNKICGTEEFRPITTKHTVTLLF